MCCRFDGGSTNALVHRGLQTQLNIKKTCRSSKKIQVRVTWCLKFHYKVNSERSAFPHHTCISCTVDRGDIVIHNIHLDIFKSQQKHFMNSNLTDLNINQEKTTRVSHWDTTMSKIKGNIYSFISSWQYKITYNCSRRRDVTKSLQRARRWKQPSARWSSKHPGEATISGSALLCRRGTFNRIYQLDVVHIKCQEWVAFPFKPPHQSTSKPPTQLNSHLLPQLSVSTGSSKLIRGLRPATVVAPGSLDDSRGRVVSLLLTYGIITLLGLTSSLRLLSLLADNCLWLGLISLLCAFWVTQAKQPVCLHWLPAGTHATCQHGQNRTCSKLITSRLCSLRTLLYVLWACVLHQKKFGLSGEIQQKNLRSCFSPEHIHDEHRIRWKRLKWKDGS